MGSCLGKHKPKRNSVCPSNIEAEIRKRMSKSASEDDIRKQVESAGVENFKVSKGGMAFTLEFNEGDPSRLPSRLADRLDGAITPLKDNGEVKYTSEEKQILAELLRNDILREKSEKAHRFVHAFDAAGRRAANDT